MPKKKAFPAFRSNLGLPLAPLRSTFHINWVKPIMSPNDFRGHTRVWKILKLWRPALPKNQSRVLPYGLPLNSKLGTNFKRPLVFRRIGLVVWKDKVVDGESIACKRAGKENKKR
ncbi:hypothetical protein BTUL_0258g00030 [Botrytis tulipae]|uniref:Uncharacterized protein n=1 Tax=Botrytis tulipae TaxID=87230 RepID=A0A4Z1E6D5_9HELO|nr:hypothetical protein BTUL_0258g00030 [Botrytis tulipae]